jgi:flagella basal body P-ring formation protein FlgA
MKNRVLYLIFFAHLVSMLSAYNYNNFHSNESSNDNDETPFKLKSSYVFQNDYITSFDILPEAGKNIFIKKPDPNEPIFYIDAKEIKEKFLKYNVKIDIGRIRRVKFIKLNPAVCLTDIAQVLEELFIQKYPNLHIESIEVLPKNYLEKLPKNYQINIKQGTMRRNEGYFYLELENRKRVYFTYQLEGTFNVLKANKNIQRNQVIDFENTYLSETDFIYAQADYINEKQLGSIKAKYNITKNNIITERMIRKQALIEKGSIVKAFLKDGAILIKIDVKAITSGALGDTITVKTLDTGAYLKAIIVSKELVEIE